MKNPFCLNLLRYYFTDCVYLYGQDDRIGSNKIIYSHNREYIQYTAQNVYA